MVREAGMEMHGAPRRAGRLVLACLSFAVALLGCGGGGGHTDSTQATPVALSPSQPTVQPGAVKPGVLAISSSMRLDPFPTTPDQYLAVAEEAVDLSYSAGARGQMTTYTWKKLEPTQGSYDAKEWNGLDWWMTQSQKRNQVNYIGISTPRSARCLPAWMCWPSITPRSRRVFMRCWTS
jgi:hypothetical protein